VENSKFNEYAIICSLKAQVHSLEILGKMISAWCLRIVINCPIMIYAGGVEHPGAFGEGVSR
jgi:hypothetical protein